MVESYLVGSETIYLLTYDPLLPEEIMSPDLRLALTQAMLDYDKIGKKIWTKKLSGFALENNPLHLHIILE